MLDVKSVLKDAKTFLSTQVHPNSMDLVELIKNQIVQDIKICKSKASENVEKYNIEPLNH